MERLLNGLQPALESLRDDAWIDAATGIMTTDTTPKVHLNSSNWTALLIP